MTENQETSGLAINYDVNTSFSGLSTAERNYICSMGSFKDRPTVNLLDCQHLIDAKHLCSEQLNMNFELCRSLGENPHFFRLP